jgi:hypothetical protein
VKTAEEYKLQYALNDTVTPANEAEELIYTLITEFANDKNSSKYREDVTKIMVGLRPSEGKLGYDDDFAAIEVKPANITSTGKLDGKGNFSDLTWARHNKYLRDNLRMLVSGFQNGKLFFIAEFPYTSIAERIEYLLNKKLPNGDMKGHYVRNASFTYNHWIHHPYKVLFLRDNIAAYKPIFNKKFFSALINPTHDS